MQQGLIADAGHRTTGVAAERLGAFDVVGLQTLVDVSHEATAVDLREREINDALDAKRQTQHQGEGYERHEACRAFEELALELLVQATTLERGIRGLQVGIDECHGTISKKGVSS